MWRRYSVVSAKVASKRDGLLDEGMADRSLEPVVDCVAVDSVANRLWPDVGSTP